MPTDWQPPYELRIRQAAKWWGPAWPRDFWDLPEHLREWWLIAGALYESAANKGQADYEKLHPNG